MRVCRFRANVFTLNPPLAPEKRPSVITAVLGIFLSISVTRCSSLIPGPPLGPSYLTTTMLPGLILSSFCPLGTADVLTKAPFGAKFP